MNALQQRMYIELKEIAKNRGWELLSINYVNAKTNLLFLCPNKHEREMNSNNFKTGQGCIICSRNKNTNALQQKMYIELKELAKNRGWELISINYIDAKTHLIFKCPNEHMREMTPDNFKQGKGCAICSGHDPISARLWFENRVKELGGTLVGKYVDAHIPVSIICEDGHPTSIIPNNLKSGQGICRACAGLDPKVAEQKFINRVKELGGTVIGKYSYSHIPVEALCPIGHICTPTPQNVNRVQNICLKCSSGQYEAELNFIARVNQLGGKIMSPYVNNYTPVDVLCKNNHECSIYPTNIQAGYVLCSICDGSKGENLVVKSLDLLGLKYISQYKLPGKSFRYDFATGINLINTVIEWDGIQHFKFNDLFHKTTENFIYGQNCDREKTKDIINLGCKIIRIDYKCGNKSIEEIAQFIYLSLQSNNQLILSNPDMYKWLTDC